MGILWNYLLGYVIIEIKGGGLERFLNHAVINGVELWNVKRTGVDSISAYTGVSGFYALRKLARGRALRLSILDKRGLPISLKRFRFRKVLLFGWVFAAALVIAATRCIWVVRVKGCDRVAEAALIDTLSDMGIGAGTPRYGLDVYSIGADIMREDERIAWAGAQLEGVVFTLTVYEADEPTELVDEGAEPRTLYAKRDGRIVFVTALMGLAAVKAGDVVVKGQPLITGDLSTEEREGPFVAARGEVIAETVYVFTAEAGPYADELVRSGEYTDSVRIIIGNRSNFAFTFAPSADGAAKSEYEYELISRAAVRNCILPLEAERIRRHTLTVKNSLLPEDKLKAAAIARAEAEMLSVLPHEGMILEKTTRTALVESGAVRAVITVIMQEDIGEAGTLYDGNRRENDGDGQRTAGRTGA